MVTIVANVVKQFVLIILAPKGLCFTMVEATA